MAYDAVRSRGLLFGGHRDGAPSLGDTWEFDGATWWSPASAPREATTPPAREAHALAYDGARGRVLLFGGRSCDSHGLCTPLNDVWLHDSTGWRELATVAPPSPRYGVAMAFDDERGVLVMSGGRSCASDACAFDETWELDGDAWTRRSTTPLRADAPHNIVAGVGEAPALVFHPAMGHVVAFAADPVGVRAPFVAAWDGVAWADMEAPAFTAPSLASVVAVYDTSRARIVLFGDALIGGAAVSRAVEWDGLAWPIRTPESPDASAPARRVGAAVFFDILRGRAVTFGGRLLTTDGGDALLRDTWEYDGGPVARNDSGTSPDADAGADAAATTPPPFAKGVEPADFGSVTKSPVWFGNPHAGDCGCRTAVGSAAPVSNAAAPVAFAAFALAGIVARRRIARRSGRRRD